MVLLGRGVARIAVGAMGAAITIAFGMIALGLDVRSRGGRLAAARLVMVLGIARSSPSVCCSRRSVSRPARSRGATRKRSPGALFLVSGAVFPLVRPARPLQAVGLLDPLTWWLEGVRLAVFPAGLSGIGGAGSLWTTVTGTSQPDAATIVIALLVTGALVTLAATGIFRASERRAKDRGLLDQTTGS